MTRSVRERQHLEYKRDFWVPQQMANGEARDKKVVELCKDVAAMLNAEGGDIIVGIEEDDDDCAKCWYGLGSLDTDGAISTLQSSLNSRLSPRQSANSVTCIPVEHEGKWALVVSVAPFAHGLVSVSVGGANARHSRVSHLFPVRDGDETRFLSVEEAARSMDVRLRTLQLEAAALFGRPARQLDVWLDSEFNVWSTGGSGPWGRPLDGKADGTLTRLDETTLQLVFHRGATVRRQVEQMNEFVAYKHSRKFDWDHLITHLTPGARKANPEPDMPGGSAWTLSIPMTFVRALWRPASADTEVRLALTADVVWDGAKLRLSV